MDIHLEAVKKAVSQLVQEGKLIAVGLDAQGEMVYKHIKWATTEEITKSPALLKSLLN